MTRFVPIAALLLGLVAGGGWTPAALAAGDDDEALGAEPIDVLTPASDATPAASAADDEPDDDFDAPGTAERSPPARPMTPWEYRQARRAARLAAGRRIVGPPIRLDTRIVVRPETNPGPLLELGVQVYRTERIMWEAVLSYTGHHNLGLTGPRRTMGNLDFGGDMLFALGSWIATGPSASLSFRFFRQQWTPIDELWVPVAGWRLTASVVRARTWSFDISAKANMDLIAIDLVRETAEVRRMIPIEGQLGMRWKFGHGRAK